VIEHIHIDCTVCIDKNWKIGESSELTNKSPRRGQHSSNIFIFMMMVGSTIMKRTWAINSPNIGNYFMSPTWRKSRRSIQQQKQQFQKVHVSQTFPHVNKLID
jgi:hypothetical protein